MYNVTVSLMLGEEQSDTLGQACSYTEFLFYSPEISLSIAKTFQNKYIFLLK